MLLSELRETRLHRGDATAARVRDRTAAKGRESGAENDRGIATVQSRLAELAERHGARFRPDPGWKSLESGGNS